jgi:hypothetical protein
MLRRSLVIGDLNTELGRVAKQSLKLGGDRTVVGSSENGPRQARRRCSSEKLAHEGKCDKERGKWRPERGQTALCALRSPVILRAAHVDNAVSP